jgi:hypothetical protein
MKVIGHEIEDLGYRAWPQEFLLLIYRKGSDGEVAGGGLEGGEDLGGWEKRPWLQP